MSTFDKVSGSYDSYLATSITDSTAEWTVNAYQNWYVLIDSVEYKITSNTADTLTFSNSLIATGTYEIAFLGRTYLTEIESDCSNSTKIPDALILKKYNQASIDVYNKLFAYLRKMYTTDFDPLAYIINIYILQQAYVYYMLYLLYTDLAILEQSFNTYKAELYYNQYKDAVKDGLALIQIDFDKDGVADADEKTSSAGGIALIR